MKVGPHKRLKRALEEDSSHAMNTHEVNAES